MVGRNNISSNITASSVLGLVAFSPVLHAIGVAAPALCANLGIAALAASSLARLAKSVQRSLAAPWLGIPASLAKSFRLVPGPVWPVPAAYQ